MKIITQLFLLAVTFPYVRTLSCPNDCSDEACQNPANCTGSMVMDDCRCCKWCTRLEGETCGGKFNIHGPCDVGLNCVATNKLPNDGICQRAPVEDLCKKKKCGFRQQCTINKHGRAVCICPRNCRESKGRPVCGYKNGKQYKNPCELYRHECRSGREIGRFNGPCKKCFHHGKPYRLGEARRGPAPCEKCDCYHGDWICKTKKHCQDRIDFCTVFNDPKGGLSSTCPPGYWCKVQIPSIPEQNIPGVGRCVSITKSDDANSSSGTVSASNVTTTAVKKNQTGDALVNPCDLSPQAGPCQATVSRWYYNKSRRKCMKFAFGGCGVNANNFTSKSSCRTKCMRRRGHLVKTTAPTRPTSAVTTNRTTQQPRPTTEGSRNMTVICNLPPAPGPCRAAMPQWFHNTKKQRCVQFIYGGCGGNDNNFDTKVECKKACMRNKGTMPTPPTDPTTRINSESESTNRTLQTSQFKFNNTTTTTTPPHPATKIPTTKVQTTEVPSTKVPTTKDPTTKDPTTKVLSTKVLSTKVPSTKVPSTKVPSTKVPSTKVPSTKVLSTKVLSTKVPSTKVPTTKVHSTKVPSTKLPSTKVPSTKVPTTKVPSTKVPSTKVPTTKVPSTKVTTTKTYTPNPTPGQKVFSCPCSECPLITGEETCDTHYGCFTSQIQHTDGSQTVKYGCLENEEHYTIVCNVRSPDAKQPKMLLECCKGHMCNQPEVRSRTDVSQTLPKKTSTISTQATVVKETASSEIPRCFDAHSSKFYGEKEGWKPNDCTVCACHGGHPECVATVCRHPNCVDPIRVKGQCCPVCTFTGNDTEDSKDMIKALAQSELTTVLVSIKKDKDKRFCEDMKSGELYTVGQNWKVDDCTTCYCQGDGKIGCAVQMCNGYPGCENPVKEKGHCCPVCPEEPEDNLVSSENEVINSPHSCLDSVTGDHYRLSEMWQQDDCTACTCQRGRKSHCRKSMCKKLSCTKTIHLKGRCCHACEEDAKSGCIFEGMKYLPGEYKLLADHCTLCECKNLEWHCSTRKCRKNLNRG